MPAHTLIAILGTLPLLALPFFATPDTANYRYSFVFLVPTLWGLRAARGRLRLHPLHYALFALALFLHNLGALGLYTRQYYDLAFDTYVHFYFGLVGALIIERGFRLAMGLRPWQVWIATILFVLGLGAIHELVELSSTVVLGEKMGMYKIGNTDEFDTQKDLLNNLLGSVLALCFASATTRLLSRCSE